jgi:tRNA 2-selenouridine synthase
VRIEASVPDRVSLLRDEYRHFIADPAALREKLGHLRALRGAEALSRWNAMIDAGDWDALVRDLLVAHYDPTYLRSMRGNYPLYDDAVVVEVTDCAAAYAGAAQRVIALEGA